VEPGTEWRSLLVASLCADATTVLDTGYMPATTPPNGSVIRSDISNAQTFTIARSGTLTCVAVELRNLYLGATSPLTPDTRMVEGNGVPYEPRALGLRYVTMPRRTALRTSSAVLCRSSFSMMRQRWVSTVCRLRLRRRAISLLLLPSARSW